MGLRFDLSYPKETEHGQKEEMRTENPSHLWSNANKKTVRNFTLSTDTNCYPFTQATTVTTDISLKTQNYNPSIPKI